MLQSHSPFEGLPSKFKIFDSLPDRNMRDTMSNIIRRLHELIAYINMRESTQSIPEQLINFLGYMEDTMSHPIKLRRRANWLLSYATLVVNKLECDYYHNFHDGSVSHVPSDHQILMDEIETLADVVGKIKPMPPITNDVDDAMSQLYDRMAYLITMSENLSTNSPKSFYKTAIERIDDFVKKTKPMVDDLCVQFDVPSIYDTARYLAGLTSYLRLGIAAKVSRPN